MQHYFSRQHSQVSQRDRINIEPYIQIVQERITAKRVVLHSIRFNLDKNILKQIRRAQQTGYALDISPSLLADLRYYAILDQDNRRQSELTFYTYYQRRGFEEALMRSVISIDGEITHQIKRDCLERPNFCRQLASAHYWLIAQLLSQLRLRIVLKLGWLAWGLALLIVAAISIPLVPQLLQINPLLLLVPVLVVWLLQVILQRLLRLLLPFINRWVWRQFLSSLLSRKPLDQKVAFLARLIP